MDSIRGTSSKIIQNSETLNKGAYSRPVTRSVTRAVILKVQAGTPQQKVVELVKRSQGKNVLVDKVNLNNLSLHKQVENFDSCPAFLNKKESDLIEIVSLALSSGDTTNLVENKILNLSLSEETEQKLKSLTGSEKEDFLSIANEDSTELLNESAEQRGDIFSPSGWSDISVVLDPVGQSLKFSTPWRVTSLNKETSQSLEEIFNTPQGASLGEGSTRRGLHFDNIVEGDKDNLEGKGEENEESRESIDLEEENKGLEAETEEQLGAVELALGVSVEELDSITLEPEIKDSEKDKTEESENLEPEQLVDSEGENLEKTEEQLSEEEDFNQFDLLFVLGAQEEGFVQGQENILGMAEMKVEDGGALGDVSKMKIRMHPGTFDGSCGEDVNEWLLKYERAARVNQWTDGAAKARFLPCFLTKAAAAWFENFEQNATEAGLKDYATIKQKMEEAFDADKTAEGVEYRLRSRRMKDGEDCAIFYHDILRLCKRVNPQMKDEAIVRHLLQGLSPNIQKSVMLQKNDTPAEFFENAKRAQKAQNYSAESDLLQNTKSFFEKLTDKISDLTVEVKKVKNVGELVQKVAEEKAFDAGGAQGGALFYSQNANRGRGRFTNGQHLNNYGRPNYLPSYPSNFQGNYGNGGAANRGERPPMRCFYCNKIGHQKIDCKSMKRDEEYRRNRMRREYRGYQGEGQGADRNYRGNEQGAPRDAKNGGGGGNHQ